jgi:chemotaxis protein MotB
MANDADETDRLERRRPPPLGRFGLTGWLLFFLALAVGVCLYDLWYLPLEQDRARLRQAERDARSEADHASGRLSVLEPSVETLTTERDRLRSERDRLAAESGELASTVAERDAEIARLESTRTQLETQLHAEIAGGDISVEDIGGEIRVRLAEQILFAPGSADLSTHGQAVLRRVAATLSTIEGHVIEVGGHTDATPLSETTQERFPTNWELSTARATTVVRFLQDQCSIPGERLVAAGYSQYRPATTLDTPAGRRRNRRIELILRPLRVSDAADDGATDAGDADAGVAPATTTAAPP